jgi:myo-inositol-1-phosphate synthase
MITEIEPARGLPLPDVANFVVSGWDLTRSDPGTICRTDRVFSDEHILASLHEVPAPNTFSPIILPTDYAAVRNNVSPTHTSWQKAIDQVQLDIEDFRRRENVSEVVVLNLSSPHRNAAAHILPGELDRAVKNNDPAVSSSVLYCLAAMRSGCSYVDFTPTDTLELPDVLEEAAKHGAPVAGRDGSTGQTLTKSVLAHMFELRHLPIQGWYSTNILGNHDGLVLADPEFSETKVADKKEVLDLIAPGKPHLVGIRYYPPRRDCKEAWDCVDFAGWMGEVMSVGINWIGRDSVLAAPLLIDLSRLMVLCQKRGLVGLQSDLGVFFKHPLGTSERRYFYLFEDFRRFCESLSK